MKKVLLMLVVLAGLVFPLACNDLNNSPTTPATATATPTPSSSTGAVFRHNYGTAAAPNGMSYNAATGVLYVACGESGVTKLEHFFVNPDSQLTDLDGYNKIRLGCPTPQPPTPSPTIPPWEGTELVLSHPQAYVFKTNVRYILDSPPSGGAVLYQQNTSDPQGYSFYSNGYSGVPFTTPKGMAIDSSGNIYIADSGNGYIDYLGKEYDCAIPESHHVHDWLHRWNGAAPDLLFREPRGIVCDSTNHVIVADAGYSPSIIQTYSSGGTTIINHFQTIPNCVAYGIDVDSSGNIYVADAGNNLIEVYDTSGNLLRMWGDPHSPHEYLPFKPGCVAVVGDPVQYVIVGDINNDLVQVFELN
jgi:hypothetical protein